MSQYGYPQYNPYPPRPNGGTPYPTYQPRPIPQQGNPQGNPQGGKPGAGAQMAEGIGTAASLYEAGSALYGGGSVAAPNILSVSGVTTGTSGAVTGSGATMGATGGMSTGVGGGMSTAGTGAGTGSSTLATAGTAAWILAAVYAAYTGYSNYKDLKKKGIEPGDYTDEEWSSIAYPDAFGLDKYLKDDNVQMVQDYSPMGKYGVGAFFTASKEENQVHRDRTRDRLEEGGLLSKNDAGSHQIGLADGSMYDVGRDGQTSFMGTDGEQVKHGYQSDWSNPLTSDAAGQYNAFRRMYSPDGNDRGFGSQLINASVSNGDVTGNFKGFYDKAGIDRQGAIDNINKAYEAGHMSEWEKLAEHNAVNQTFGDDGSGSYNSNNIGTGVNEAHQAAYDQFQAGQDPTPQPSPTPQQTDPSMDPEVQKVLRDYGVI